MQASSKEYVYKKFLSLFHIMKYIWELFTFLESYESKNSINVYSVILIE